MHFYAFNYHNQPVLKWILLYVYYVSIKFKNIHINMYRNIYLCGYSSSSILTFHYAKSPPLYFHKLTRESVSLLSCVQLFGDPINCNLPGFSVHGIFQARILEWVAVYFSKVSSQPRDQTQFSHTTGRFYTIWATREAPSRSVVSDYDSLWPHGL